MTHSNISRAARIREAGFSAEENRRYKAPGGRATKGLASRTGVPNGMRRTEVITLRSDRAAKAINMGTALAKQRGFQGDDVRVDIFAFLAECIITEINPLRERLSAAKTLLEYTLPKPPQEAHLTLSMAEEFLEAVWEAEQAENAS